MKLETRKHKHFDMWVLRINDYTSIRVFFYTLRSAITHVKQNVILSIWKETFKDSHILIIESPFIYIELIIPRFLLWVNDQKLINFALSILKERLNELDDNTAYYLLGKSSLELDHDELAESQVLNQILNFYGVNKNEN